MTTIHVTPEDFPAEPNDRAKIQAAVNDAIANGKEVVLTKVYDLGQINTGAKPSLGFEGIQITGARGLTIRAVNGAEIRTTTADRSAEGSGLNTPRVFAVRDSQRVTFEGVRVVDLKTTPPLHMPKTGAVAFCVLKPIVGTAEKPSGGITLRNCEGVTCLTFFNVGIDGGDEDKAIEGITIEGCVVRGCRYGLSFHGAGDMVRADYRCYECVRDYYNISAKNHRIRCVTYAPEYRGRFAYPIAALAGQRVPEDVELDVAVKSLRDSATSDSIVGIAHSARTPEDTRVIRNIRVRLDLSAVDAPNMRGVTLDSWSLRDDPANPGGPKILVEDATTNNGWEGITLEGFPPNHARAIFMPSVPSKKVDIHVGGYRWNPAQWTKDHGSVSRGWMRGAYLVGPNGSETHGSYGTLSSQPIRVPIDPELTYLRIPLRFRLTVSNGPTVPAAIYDGTADIYMSGPGAGTLHNTSLTQINSAYATPPGTPALSFSSGALQVDFPSHDGTSGAAVMTVDWM